MVYRQLIPKGFMVANQMLFMVGHSCLTVMLSSDIFAPFCICFPYLTFDFVVAIGLPPLVLRRVLEILTYLALNHSSVANMLFHYDPSILFEPLSRKNLETKKDRGKEEKIMDGDASKSLGNSQEGDVPLILFLKLLNRPLFLHSTAHLEQVVFF